MLKIVIMNLNIMGLKAKPPNLIRFCSITPELVHIISSQMCTQLNMTLNSTTRAIFRISHEIISPKSIYNASILSPDDLKVDLTQDLEVGLT